MELEVIMPREISESKRQLIVSFVCKAPAFRSQRAFAMGRGMRELAT